MIGARAARIVTTLLLVAASAAVGVATARRSALADEPVAVRVNVFPGIANLAIFAAQAKGSFTRHAVRVELSFTPDSPTQRAAIAKGTFDIAHAGVDNAVALAESGVDTIIVMGGDSSMQELFAQPDIQASPICATRSSSSTRRTPPTR